jgi:hypothetical protein
MNEYQHYEDGSGSMATEYPKSDNNGSVSDASTIPKDGDHLKEGLEATTSCGVVWRRCLLICSCCTPRPAGAPNAQ